MEQFSGVRVITKEKLGYFVGLLDGRRRVWI